MRRKVSVNLTVFSAKFPYCIIFQLEARNKEKGGIEALRKEIDDSDTDEDTEESYGFEDYSSGSD